VNQGDVAKFCSKEFRLIVDTRNGGFTTTSQRLADSVVAKILMSKPSLKNTTTFDIKQS